MTARSIGKSSDIQSQLKHYQKRHNSVRTQLTHVQHVVSNAYVEKSFQYLSDALDICYVAVRADSSENTPLPVGLNPI